MDLRAVQSPGPDRGPLLSPGSPSFGPRRSRVGVALSVATERRLVSQAIRAAGVAVQETDRLEQLERILHRGAFAAVVLGSELASRRGLALLQRAPEPTPAIVVAGDRVDRVLDAVRWGALECVLPPPRDRGRIAELARLCVEHRTALEQRILARSPALRAVVRRVGLFAPEEDPVLVTGETGVGKEVVARALHAASPRAAGPFVAVNLSALPEGTLESELFGHERGAFTGATHRRAGRFEQAQGGTILLDEIGDAPPRVQAELLRVVESRRLTRLGGTGDLVCDVRILAATHRDLPDAIRRGAFREDLWHRLGALQIHVPPLRERPEDVDALVERELWESSGQRGGPPFALDEPARGRLRADPWPGNARELRLTVRRMVVLAGGRRHLGLPDVEAALGSEPRPARASGLEPPGPPASRSAFAEQERAEVLALLAAHRWNVSAVARDLGVSRGTLRNRLQRLGIGSSRRESRHPSCSD